jgi:hypothetical protein
MFRRTLVTASVSAVLGMAAMMPTAALAQFGPPPGPPPGLAGPPPGIGGPPPGLGGLPPGLAGPRLAGPPPGLGGPNGGPPRAGLGGPRAGGDGPRFSRLDGTAAGRGLEGRSALAARSSAGGYGRYGYSRSGYGYGRGRYWARGVYAAYGSSYASSDDGCYYISAYRRGAYRSVLVCD